MGLDIEYRALAAEVEQEARKTLVNWEKLVTKECLIAINPETALKGLISINKVKEKGIPPSLSFFACSPYAPAS